MLQGFNFREAEKAEESKLPLIRDTVRSFMLTAMMNEVPFHTCRGS
jgi:hypothetical protein